MRRFFSFIEAERVAARAEEEDEEEDDDDEYKLFRL
jgi:hypothetical protein